LDFFSQKENCGALHAGTTASMQRGGFAAFLLAASAPLEETPNKTAPQITLKAIARSIAMPSLFSAAFPTKHWRYGTKVLVQIGDLSSMGRAPTRPPRGRSSGSLGAW
jgi:hypothetical protein